MKPTTRTRAALAALALALAMTSAAAEAASSSPWSGYRIRTTSTADGGFMGARLVDGKVSYRIDADARAVSTGYRRVRRVSEGRLTARAAWILSKYGAVKIADQSAAVDAATYALLSGKRLAGPRATKRLRQTGRPGPVRRLARVMLAQSKRHAGPYTLALRTVPSVVGGRVGVRATVTTATGEPVPRLPVVIRLPGIAEAHQTNARGRVAATFPAEEVGLRKVVVEVQRVPEWRLLLRKPVRRAASRIAVAGRKTRLVARGVVAVRVQPTVTVPPAPGPAQTDRLFNTGFTLTGSEGVPRRQATLSLFGPFLLGATPACTGTPAVTTTTTVTADGTYTGPRVRVARAGRYIWRVQVAASQLNQPAQTCGGVVRVRTRPRIALEGMPGPKAGFTIHRLPAGYDDTAVLSLYGPYPRKADATCKPRRLVGQVEVRVARNGEFAPRRVDASRPGVYAWQLRMPAGDLVLATTTRCGLKDSFSVVS